MRIEFQNLYDSHIHLQFTAEKASALSLSYIRSFSDLCRLPSKQPENFRGEFLIGFGWSHFEEPDLGSKLDQIFPTQPIFFTRKDGHAALINSSALKLLDLPSLRSGLVEEEDHFLTYSRLPAPSSRQLQAQLITVQKIFLSQGFTHVRDMTMNEMVWKELELLSQSKQFRLAVEAYIHVTSPQNFPASLAAALRMQKTEQKNLRLRGLKFFYDGTLGAETALLSCGCGSQGLRQWSQQNLEEAFRQAWSSQLEVAVHTIGDLAVEEVVDIARSLSSKGQLGRLCLEHAEVVKPETIQKMKPLHIEVHMQPCHFLSDRNFLRERLGQNLIHAFPWSRFERAQIPLFFGSDSPIEPPNFFRNRQALHEAERQFRIQSVKADLAVYHTHPDKAWWPSRTLFENEKVTELTICEEKMI